LIATRNALPKTVKKNGDIWLVSFVDCNVGIRVLHEIRQKQITQREAASRLKISDRHIRSFAG
jgi:hypothetical protein